MKIDTDKKLLHEIKELKIFSTNVIYETYPMWKQQELIASYLVKESEDYLKYREYILKVKEVITMFEQNKIDLDKAKETIRGI